MAPDSAVSPRPSDKALAVDDAAALLAPLGLVANAEVCGQQQDPANAAEVAAQPRTLRKRAMGSGFVVQGVGTEQERSPPAKKLRVVGDKLKTRRAHFAQLLPIVLDASLHDKDDTIVDIIVNKWNDNTKDNYL